MKYMIAVLTALFVFAHPCHCDDQSPNPSLEVDRLDTVPSFFSHKVPHGFQEMYLGKARIAPLPYDFFIHIFAKPNKAAKDLSEGEIAESEVELDLYRGHKGRHGMYYHLLNSSHLNPKFMNYPVNILFVQWLRPSTKQSLVIRVVTSMEGGFWGPSGQAIVLVYPGQLNGRPKEQLFDEFWSFNSSDTTSFEKLDERGIMMATTNSYRDSGGVDIPGNPAKADWKWDGKQFVAPPEPKPIPTATPEATSQPR